MPKINDFTPQQIEKKTKVLYDIVNYHTQAYSENYKQFQKYQGKQLDERSVKEVNIILEEMQDSFAKLYPIYHFIGQLYQHANEAVSAHQQFIDMLKKAGAKPTENPNESQDA